MKKLIPQLLGGTPPKPTKTEYTVLRQLVQWIPSGMIQRLADEHKLDIRKWSAVSHVVALMYGQLAGCDSLNGIVDAARVHEGEWRNIRGAEPPKRNTFSNANRHRDADMAERLYWEVFDHLAGACPGFGEYRRHKGFLARLKRGIFAIDSSTIKLSLNCIDWARHRRRKAAAKLHLRLDVGSRLPAFAVAELYKARWSIELFFKELKQTCLIHDFVGYNENAVRWQVWTGLLVHLLLRFMRHVAGWELSFSRLAGVVRAAVWVKRDLTAILKTYGTAPRPKRGEPAAKPPPLQAFFDFWRFDYGTASP